MDAAAAVPMRPGHDRTGEERPAGFRNSRTVSSTSSDGSESFRAASEGGLSVSAVKSLSINDFTVMCQLGQGGFGTVMLARKKTSSTLYAMKMIAKNRMAKRNFADLIIAEAEAMQTLKHPFIVRLYGAFHDAARVYFLLEVREFADQNRPPPPSATTRVHLRKCVREV